MKKIAFSLLFLIGLLPLIQSQTVDSIMVEQAGDFIKIRFKILNSTTDQIYKVKVLCSINGGMNNEIRSITGDVGDQVIGGKPEYWVVWDVLKDVDEINSVEFIVRAELMKDNSLSSIAGSITLANRKFHVIAVVRAPEPQFGIRLGYIGNWGISAMYLKGKIQYHNTFTGSLDLTKRIVNKESFKLHLFSGIILLKIPMYDESDFSIRYDINTISGDVGLIGSINRLVFSTGFTGIGPYYNKLDLKRQDSKFFFFGLGMRF